MFGLFKKKKEFSIEYYPITGKYFAKYNNLYLHTNRNTGIVNTIKPYLFEFADKFNCEEDAFSLIDLFKEQRLKENITTRYV
jgi:hypothetical protein